MNQTSNKMLKIFIFYILLPFALVKLLYSIGGFFLVKDDLQASKGQNLGYHYSLNFANKILQNGTIQPQKVQIEATNRIKDIKLKGTYLDDVNSFIVIEDHLGTTFLYKGDRYVGYTLKEIYDSRAIFEKAGKNYDLVIDEDDHKPMKQSHNIGGMEKNSYTNESQESFAPVSVPREEVNSYIKNPNKIWQNIRIQELRKNGRIDGFRVNYVKKGSFFDTSGLKSGDIIKSIDGNEIHSLSDVMKYYNNINNLDGLALTVQRGENMVDLEFNIN